jgi:hypothetical protein
LPADEAPRSESLHIGADVLVDVESAKAGSVGSVPRAQPPIPRLMRARFIGSFVRQRIKIARPHRVECKKRDEY